MATTTNSRVKQVAIDRSLLAVNSVYCKQVLLDTVDGYEDVTLDLSQVTDCDTAGVQLLLSLKKTAEAKNRTVQLTNVPEVVLESARKWGVELGAMFPMRQ